MKWCSHSGPRSIYYCACNTFFPLSSFVSEECKNSPPDWIPTSVSISVTRTRARVCSRWACSHLRGAPRCDQNNPFSQRYSASNSDLERVTSLGSRPKIASHACPSRDSRSLEGGDLIRRGVSVTTFWQHVEWSRRVKRRGWDRSAVSNCSSYFKVNVSVNHYVCH